MSYHREWEWDDPSESRQVTIKRYVIPDERDRDHDDFMSRQDYPERGMIVRRHERHTDYDDHRYVHSEDDEDPYGYYHHRRPRERIDRPSRRQLSPDDSISQRGSRRDLDGYSSDDSFYNKHDRHHHRRHMAEGAVVGASAAELMRSHSRRRRDDDSSHASRFGKTLGAGALGAVAVNAGSHMRKYYRSKSRHRHHSDDDSHFGSRRSDHRDRSRHRHSRHSRYSRYSGSRSRSHSHSRTKTLLELGLGAAAVAAGVAALRSKSDAGRKSRNQSRSRPASRAGSPDSRKDGKDKNGKGSEPYQHMAGAGLAGAAVAGIVDSVRSHSRARKDRMNGRSRSRSRSRIRRAIPVAAAGLATAAATGLYEKRKSKNAEDEQAELEANTRGRQRSRSHHRSSSQPYPDPAGDPALIEYGNHPVEGSIPAEHYYGQPAASQAYLEPPRQSGRRQTLSRSRGERDSSSSRSDEESRRHRRRSRSRDAATVALGASGLGYAAHKLNERRKKSKSRERKRSSERDFEDSPRHHRNDQRDQYEGSYNSDPYEQSAYDPSPYDAPYPAGYTPSPASGQPMPAHQNYPEGTYFSPPVAESNQNMGASAMPPYNPQANYPHPPGAAPSAQPYLHSHGHGHGYAQSQDNSRLRGAEDNVRSPPIREGLNIKIPSPPSNDQSPNDQSPNGLPSSKSVAFDLDTAGEEAGYDTDDSTSTLGPNNQHNRRRRRRRSSSAPRSQYTSGRRRRHKVSYESDSTVELPNRFDSKGSPLHRDPAMDKFESLVNRFTKALF